MLAACELAQSFCLSFIKAAACAGARTKLFNACSGLLQQDMQLSMFLLPYIVQNVVSYGSDEARIAVQKEVRSSIHTFMYMKVPQNPLIPADSAGTVIPCIAS